MSVAMESSRIEIVGIGALNKDLSGIQGKLTKKGLAPLLRPGIKVMQGAIRQGAPVRTGTLKRAIRIRLAKGPNDAPRATMMTYLAKNYRHKGRRAKPFYWIFIEHGVENYGSQRNKRRGAHRKRTRRVDRWRIKPNPFVAQAFEANAQVVTDTILEKIANSL